MSAISLAIAAPELIATPASAAESAGESFMPSPTIMTVCPGSLELLYICRFVLRQYLGAEIVHTDLGRYGFSSAAAVAG